MLFIKGLIIGFGKIIPGVSGALLAINFNVYEKMINSLTNFFDDWKVNLKFLLILGSGIFSAIIFGSNVILFLLTNYKFVTLMFFIGLITGGVYDFSKSIKFTYRGILIILLINMLLLFVNFNSFNNTYIFNGKFIDNFYFFLSGGVEIIASVVPGISGTAILMMMGMYDYILKMISMLYDLKFVFDHIMLYISYGLGMLISFVLSILLVRYCLNKHHNLSYMVIFGLSLSSIIVLLIMAFKIKATIFELIVGLVLLILGCVVSFIINK